MLSGSALASRSGGKYDGLTHFYSIGVQAGDLLSTYFSGAGLDMFGDDTWSQQSFIWIPPSAGGIWGREPGPQVSTWDLAVVNTAENAVIGPLQQKYSSDPALFEATATGIKVKRAGQLFIAVEQDFRSAGSSSYVTLKVQKNAGDLALFLASHSNSVWDSISAAITTDVQADDEIEFWYGGGDILSMDHDVWSHYNFIWIPPNSNNAMATLYPDEASKNAVLTDASTWLNMVFRHNGDSSIFSVSGDEITIAKAVRFCFSFFTPNF